MTNRSNMIPIAGRLHSVAEGNIGMGANEILHDEAEQTMDVMIDHLKDYEEYVPNRATPYAKGERCTLFACVWESKIANNQSNPAILDGETYSIVPNTADWKKVSGDYEAWLLNKDKPATSGTTGDYPYNGRGKVVLKKNMVGGVNVLTHEAFEDSEGNPLTNTVFVIKYDFVLGENITIPANCVLEFDGGSISGNGENKNIINGNNTRFAGNLNSVFRGIYFSALGTYNCPVIDTDWFNDLSGDGALRVIQPLLSLNNAKHIDVYIRDKGYNYIFDMTQDNWYQPGLTLPSNSNIYIAAKLKVKANNKSGYRLLMVQNGNNVHIIGGELEGDLDGHVYNDSGEYCHGIGCYQSSNVTIENVHIHHFPGDCIGYNGSQTENSDGLVECNCRGMRIINCKIHDCRRNGISVTNSEDSIIEGCEIYNVQEVDPWSGGTIGMENAIEIEPNRVSTTINGYARGIIIQNCKIHDCVYGIRTVALGTEGETGNLGCYIQNVKFNNLYFEKIATCALHLTVEVEMKNIIINGDNNKTLLSCSSFAKIDRLNIYNSNIYVGPAATLILSNSDIYSNLEIGNNAILELNGCNSNIGTFSNSGSLKYKNCRLIADNVDLEGKVYIIDSIIESRNLYYMFHQTKAVTFFIKNNIFRISHENTGGYFNFFWCNTSSIMSGLISDNIFECKNVIDSAFNIAAHQSDLSGDNNIFKEPKNNDIGYFYLTSIKRQVPKLVNKSLLSSLPLSTYEKGTTTFCQDHNGGAPVFWNGTDWVDATGTPV